MKNRKLKTILTAGFVAGLLDIAGAIFVYAYLLAVSTPQKILQSVAAGALGKQAARDGGWNTAMIGLGFHFLIALIFATFFMLLFPLWKRLFANRWLGGIVYGVLVWCVMNLAVLPIVMEKAYVFNLKNFLYGLSLIILMVGIPISLVTHKMQSRII
jgi:uncharacterized membrane protein YagU involved in acid resistance